MINILRKEDCCGCGACFDACPKSAIIWEEDYEGFSYPKVDKYKCVDCGLCNNVCPIEHYIPINDRNAKVKPIVLGAYHKDDFVRFSSTSGGVFWGLAEDFIKHGGYVAGAIFCDHFKIKHIVTNNIETLHKIKGSKYAQSDCRGMYKEIRSLLSMGERVLATGLPCQMAGLRQFLRKDYDNLIVVDLICHSVTSPFAFDKYIRYLENRYGSDIVSYHPKNKEYGGWHDFAFVATFANGEKYIEHAGKDYFTNIFVGKRHLLCRYSCYKCRFKKHPKPSDITIGDFWGIEKIDSSFDSPKGVSKVIINSKKGRDFFYSLNCFTTKEYDEYSSIYNNARSASLIKSVERCNEKKRMALVNDMHKYELDYCMIKYFSPDVSVIQRIKKNIKLIIYKITHKIG